MNELGSRHGMSSEVGAPTGHTKMALLIGAGAAIGFGCGWAIALLADVNLVWLGAVGMSVGAGCGWLAYRMMEEKRAM